MNDRYNLIAYCTIWSILVVVIIGGFASVINGQQLAEQLVPDDNKAGITSNQNYEEQLLQEKITLDVERKPLKGLLKIIEQKSAFSVIYHEANLEGISDITIKSENRSIKEALDQIFMQTPLMYRVAGNYIIVNQKLLPKAVQVQVVTGTVTDASTGQTMPGVNVVLKGTTTGTSTDSEGQYELDVPSLQDTLVFSFIGYQTQEVPINGRTQIDVELQSQAVTGEDVVVVGYGTQQRRDLTGSIGSVNTDDFEAGLNSNPEQLLQGKVAGVQINQATGAPGAASRVRIRGVSSVNAGNSPLYVIDGMPIQNNSTPVAATSIGGQPSNNPLSTLSSSDIKSIEVLKDASATAIYGSRGSNGVIIITTKNGEKGQDFQVNVSSLTGIQTPGKKLDLLEPVEYMNVLNGIREVEGRNPIFSQEEIETVRENGGTNWQDRIFRPAPIQNHEISFSQGFENTQYRASFSMFNQASIVHTDRLVRYSGRFNIEHQANDDLSFGFNLSSTQTDNDITPQGTSPNEFAGVVGSALQFDPTFAVRNEDGEFTNHPIITADNPVRIQQGVSVTDRTQRTIGNTYVEYNVLDNWSVKLNVGVDRRNQRSDGFTSTVTTAGAGAGGIANVITTESIDYVVDANTTYSNTFNAIHEITVFGGFSFQKFIDRNSNINASGFPADVIDTDNLGLGSRETFNVGSFNIESRLQSFIGRINYTLNDKYLVTGTFREDGSSRFGPNQKFGFFPSFALGWRASEEAFLNDVDFITELKVRGSWGKTGNQEIGDFQFLQTLGSGGTTVFGDQTLTGVSPTRLPSPDLQWEQTKQTDIGIDFDLLNNKISGSFDWFRKETTDLLFSLPVPASSGFSSRLSNVGKVVNDGFEFVIETRNFSRANFQWTTSGNFSFLDNEVKDLGPITEIITGSGGSFINQFALLRPGVPLNSFFGFQIEGVFQQDDDIASSAQPNAEPGFWKFKDQNGDGTINSSDKTILGSPHPDATFGLGNTFRYKNFSASVFLRGVIGTQKLNSNRARAFQPIDERRNRLAKPLLNRWTPENPSAKFPSGANLGVFAGAQTVVNSETVENASFLRLQNVTLRYNIPFDENDFFRNAQIYVTGQNLAVITGYSGFDPEASRLGDSDILVDLNSVPFARTFQLGIDFAF